MPNRVMVVFGPLGQHADWLDALLCKATERNWQRFEHWWPGELMECRQDLDALLVTNSFDAEAAFRPTRIVCLAESPSATNIHFRDQFNYGAHSLWRTSQWFSEASASRTAPVQFVDVINGSPIEIPDLGQIKVEIAADYALSGKVENSGPLEIYDSLSSGVFNSARWPIDLFSPSQTKNLLDDWVELFGERGLIVAGPYLYLPEGRWIATMEIEVDTEDFDIVLRIDWGGSDDFTSLESVITRSGRYLIDISHDWNAAKAADFRIHIVRSAFGGRLKLSDLRVSPAEPTLAATPVRLT